MKTFNFGSRQFLRPSFSGIVRILILINVAISIVQFLIGRIDPALYNRINFFFGLVPVLVVKKYYIWQLVTYMFLHGSFFHLLLNMFILWMFGAEIESRWGKAEFLRYYFLTGIGAGLVYIAFRFSSPIPTIGASGAIYGLLLAFGMVFPNRYVYLYFFLPIKAKFLVLIFGAIEFISAFTRPDSGIAHLAHLGGLLFGFLYLKFLKGRGRFWRRFVFIDKRDEDVDAEVDDTEFEDKVNNVLRKLSKVGLDGLTPYERDILEEARKRYRNT